MSRTAVIVSVAEDSRALCRLCMIYQEYFVNVFIPNNTFGICAEEAIHDLLSLKVAVGDGLPSNICHQCVKKLMEFRDFKEMCLKTAAELRKYDLDNLLRVSKIKDENAADVETAREGNSQENTFMNDIQVTEIYITVPDEPAIGNVCHVTEEFGSFENAMLVKEEVNDGEHCTEGGVPVTAVPSGAVDPLAVDTMALKEEAQEPKGTEGEGNSLSDASPCNHIQVTEVFVPVPDQLAMEIMHHVQEDAIPTELMVKEEIHERLNCSENDMPVVPLSSVNVDPLAVDTTIDIKEDDDIRMGDCSLNIEVRREDGLLEDESSGNECSDGGAPLSETKPENQVDCCNYIGGIPEAPEINLDKFVSGRQENLQHQLPSNSSNDHMREENLQYEYSTANTLLDHCHSRKDVKTKENKKPSDPNDTSSLSNDLKQLKCDLCGKKLINSNDLKRHLVIHTGVKSFRCNMCGKNFGQKCDLKIHLVIHTGVKPFKCNMCGKNFGQKGDLMKHLAIHTGVKPFKCNVCAKNFSRKNYFKKHLAIHTGVEPYKCAVCGKTYTRNCNLARHSVVHTGEIPFKCNECGKNFTHKSDFKKHLLIHTGVKPYKCAVCGKTFTRNGSLATHSVVHTGEKPFKCNECGKNFSLKSYLKRHLLIHTGVKPCKCDVCGKMFTQKGHLKNHYTLHTGVKPFACSVCEKNFSRKCDLKRHLLIHTGVKPCKCDVCGKIFTQKGHLKSHYTLHTGVKPVTSSQ